MQPLTPYIYSSSAAFIFSFWLDYQSFAKQNTKLAAEAFFTLILAVVGMLTTFIYSLQSGVFSGTGEEFESHDATVSIIMFLCFSVLLFRGMLTIPKYLSKKIYAAYFILILCVISYAVTASR